MKKHLFMAFVAIALTVISATTVLGLWGEYENDKPVVADNWPKAIVKSINSHRRVYGAGQWDSGWTFYFTGNTADLNTFLKSVAEDDKSDLGVILSNDPGTAKKDLLSDSRKFSYSWSIHLYPNRERVFIGMEPNESEKDYKARSKKILENLPEFGAVVRIPVGGSIDLAELKLPVSFTASVNDGLTRFAKHHNQRRESVDNKTAARLQAEPTTEADVLRASSPVFTVPVDESDTKGK